MTDNMAYDPDISGTVLNIQRFSVHDGPGIRTVVFIKGCSLRCIWCSNPESMSRREQIGFHPDRCIGIDKCGACIELAPDRSALTVEDNRVTGLSAENPQDYLRSAEACPSGALKIWGKTTTVGEVMREVIADREFYEESGGGLTLSGGEALIQTRFAVELLKAAQAEGISTCVETALNVRPEALHAALPYIDLALCDLKHLDSSAHQQYTGVANKRILENLQIVADSGTPIVIRIPVVPGLNGTSDNLRATAKYLVEKLGDSVAQVQLLPFRKLGVEKYASLGISYPMQDFEAPPREVWEKKLLRHAKMMSSTGLDVVAGATARIPA